MGRSRGGLTTKIHALVDANGLPIQLKLSEGQAHDGRSAADMLDEMGQGQILLADSAYDSDGLRRTLGQRGAWANVKPMPTRKNVPAFSRYLYCYRNLVERFFNKPNTFVPSPHASKSTTPTTSHSSNSRQQGYGCGL
jgi:transposase